MGIRNVHNVHSWIGYKCDHSTMNLSAYVMFTQSGVSSGSTPKGCIDDGIDHNRHKQAESLNSNRKISMHGSLSVAVQVSFFHLKPIEKGTIGNQKLLGLWDVCLDSSSLYVREGKMLEGQVSPGGCASDAVKGACRTSL